MEPASTFYGVATIGTKGQVVIPVKAREELGLKPSDQVIIVGRKGVGGQGMLCVFPLSSAESFLVALTQKVNDVQAAIDQAKQEGKQ